MCFLLVKDLELDPKLGKLRIRILNKISEPARAPVELQFLKLVISRQCCPDSNFFHPGSRIQGQKDSGSRIRIRDFKYFYSENLISSRKYDPGSSSHNPDPESGFTTLPLRITPRTSWINLIKTFNRCVPEGEVDPLLLAGRILGYAVEPVLLHRPLHQQQRPGEQREPDEVRRSLNSRKNQEKIMGCLHAAGRLSGVICMRLSAHLALFACGWRPIWPILHAAGGQLCMRLAANSGTFCVWLAATPELFTGGRLQTSKQYW